MNMKETVLSEILSQDWVLSKNKCTKHNEHV